MQSFIRRGAERGACTVSCKSRGEAKPQSLRLWVSQEDRTETHCHLLKCVPRGLAEDQQSVVSAISPFLLP